MGGQVLQPRNISRRRASRVLRQHSNAHILISVNLSSLEAGSSGACHSTVRVSRTTSFLSTAMRGLINHRPLPGGSALQRRACTGQCSTSCRVSARPFSQAKQQQLRLHAAAVDAEVEQQTDAVIQLSAEDFDNVAAVAGSHVSTDSNSMMLLPCSTHACSFAMPRTAYTLAP
jgi:hypothetical protein